MLDDDWIILYDAKTGEETVGVLLTPSGKIKYDSGEKFSWEWAQVVMDLRRIKMADFG